MPNTHYWGFSRNCWIAVLIRADLPCLVPLVLFHNKIHTRSERIKQLVWEHIHTGNPSEFGEQRHKNRWMRVGVLLNWSIQDIFPKTNCKFSIDDFICYYFLGSSKKKKKFNSEEKQTTVVYLVLDPHAKLRTPRLWAWPWYGTPDCCGLCSPRLWWREVADFCSWPENNI